MCIYFKRAGLSFLKDFKSQKFNGFITNTLEVPLVNILKDFNFFNKLYTLINIVTIKKDRNIVGYIWFEKYLNNSIFIKEIAINPESINDILKSQINLQMYHKFKEKDIFYEGYYNKDLEKVIFKLGLLEDQKSLLKWINLNYFEFYEDDFKYCDLSIKHFKENYDEEIRCFLQNSIFYAKDRIPITIDDVFLDQNQNYYIDNYSIFLKYKNDYIGYGQIIYTNSEFYTIVNLGIVPEFRGRGFGEYLLKSILKLAKEDGLQKIYIRVYSDNEKAINLYDKVGFVDDEIILSYCLNIQ